MSPIQWQAESVRVSVLGTAQESTRPLFEQIFGTIPDEQNSRPAQGLMQESGNVASYFCLLSQQPDRIDFILSDHPTANTLDPSEPNFKPYFSIGDVAQAFETAKKFGKALLEKQAGPVSRIAFAPVLIAQASSLAEANRLLVQAVPFLHVRPDDQGAFWQISRIIQSSTGIKINRLAKWQVLSSQLVNFSPVIGSNPLGGFQRHALRAEFDINASAASSTTILGGSISRINSDLDLVLFEEFVEAATKIYELGDMS